MICKINILAFPRNGFERFIVPLIKRMLSESSKAKFRIYQ